METSSFTVYRFHDQVAFNPPTGDTFYIDKDQLKQLVTYLHDLQLDIRSTKFTNSKMEPKLI